ncbi:hypothetical protein BKA67DRAFT_130053 [Truncatella angustata]|uniref:Uncharacterized protein n=1 Tax=Truncatella angustata TaxID=152316 RepID=A0A9P8RFP7_9PEZI|nr:uncharacterized protein BKA67DRAFT_130053 [Truncatella angustata]KAH6645173.1 hypothetical protein BKA67DRAFT_130053 [Truncatella angustata]
MYNRYKYIRMIFSSRFDSSDLTWRAEVWSILIVLLELSSALLVHLELITYMDGSLHALAAAASLPFPYFLFNIFYPTNP